MFSKNKSFQGLFFWSPETFCPAKKKTSLFGVLRPFPTLLLCPLNIEQKLRWGAFVVVEKSLLGRKNPTFFLVKKKMHIIRVLALFRALGLPGGNTSGRCSEKCVPQQKKWYVLPPPKKKRTWNMFKSPPLKRKLIKKHHFWVPS